MILFVFLFLTSIFSQSFQDYKKMIEEALSQQSLAEQSFDVRIERVSGTVEILSVTEESTKLIKNYQYPLEVGDVIKTGYDGEANIYINNFAILHIPRNTQIEITEIQGEGIISLIYGALVSKMERLKNKFVFKIKTPVAICGIRGTQFVVEHNKLSNESIFGVIDEGEIEVYPGEEENENNLYRVSKNQEIVINPSTKRYKVGSLSRLVRYRSKMGLIRKNLINHKSKWRIFNQQERIKYRQALFNNGSNSNIKRPIKYNRKPVEYQNRRKLKE